MIGIMSHENNLHVIRKIPVHVLGTQTYLFEQLTDNDYEFIFTAFFIRIYKKI
jgi:hypothetical protein